MRQHRLVQPAGAHGERVGPARAEPEPACEPLALAGMPGAEPKLIPGQVYYLNLRNVSRATGTPSCTTEECNVRINVSPPN